MAACKLIFLVTIDTEIKAKRNNIPEAPAILFLRSDLTFRSDLIFTLAGKCENKIGSKIKNGSKKQDGWSLRDDFPISYLQNWESHRAAKGGRQKGIGKKVTKNEKCVTKK